MSYTSDKVRQVLEERPDLANPKDIAEVVLSSIPAKDRITALRDVLPEYCRQAIGRSRMNFFNPRENEDLEPVKKRGHSTANLQMHLSWHEKLRGQRVSIPEDGWKTFAECTVHDIQAIANDYIKRASQNFQWGDRFQQVAKEMKTSKVKTAGELPDDILGEIFDHGKDGMPS